MNKNRIKTLLKIAIAGVIVFFLFFAIYKNAGRLGDVEFSFSPLPFLLSTILLLAHFFQQALGWRALLGMVVAPPPKMESASIWFFSQISKYVPGKLMIPLMRHGLLKKYDISLSTTILSIYLEILLMTAMALAMALIFSIYWSEAVWVVIAESFRWPFSISILKGAFAAAIPFFLLAANPRILQFGLNFGLTRFGREPVEFDAPLSKMLLVSLTFLLGWLINAASVWLLFRSLGFNDSTFAPTIASAFMIAWVIGFWSLLTPGGLGVREAVITGILSIAGAPLAIIAAAVVIARLQWTGMELAGALITLPWRPRATANEAAEAATKKEEE